MRPTLFDIPYVMARDVSRHLTEALTFILKNQFVVLPDAKLKDVESQRIFSNTPMARIFRNIASAGKLNQFLFLDYSDLKTTSIPELLITEDLCIDGSAVSNVQVPAFAQKCWINLTPILGKRDSYNVPLFFTDVSRLAQLVTRAALVQAYKDKDLWLTINQSLLFIELYSTIIGQSVTNMYALNPDERRFVMTILAAYAAQRTGSQTTDPKMPPLLMRCAFLGSGVDVRTIMDDAMKYVKDPSGWMTLADVATIIQNIGPSRMKSYSPQMLYRSISISSIDSSTMIIAADYPPYWLYQLMNVASGYKNPVISGIVKTLNLKNKLMTLADDVADNANLLSALTR